MVGQFPGVTGLGLHFPLWCRLWPPLEVFLTRHISFTEKFTLSYAIGMGGTGSSPETCSRLICMLDGTGVTPQPAMLLEVGSGKEP